MQFLVTHHSQAKLALVGMSHLQEEEGETLEPY